jgi:hypothetical protein
MVSIDLVCEHLEILASMTIGSAANLTASALCADERSRKERDHHNETQSANYHHCAQFRGGQPSYLRVNWEVKLESRANRVPEFPVTWIGCIIINARILNDQTTKME